MRHCACKLSFTLGLQHPVLILLTLQGAMASTLQKPQVLALVVDTCTEAVNHPNRSISDVNQGHACTNQGHASLLIKFSEQWSTAHIQNNPILK